MNTGNNRHYRKRSFQKYFFRNLNKPLYSYKYNKIYFNKTNLGSVISENNKKRFNNTGTQENDNEDHLSLNDENDNAFTNGQEKIEDALINKLKNSDDLISKEFYIELFENMFFIEHARSISLYKKIINNNKMDVNLTPLLKEVYNNMYKKMAVSAEIKWRFKSIEVITFKKSLLLSDIVLFKIDKNNQVSFLKNKNMLYDNICVQLDCYRLIIFSNRNGGKKINKTILFNNINSFIINNFSDFIISENKKMTFPKQKIDKEVILFYKQIIKKINNM